MVRGLIAFEAAMNGGGVVETEPASALEYLQDIYRGRRAYDPWRVRAATEALPYENPKLSAMAVTSLNANDFASALDRAIQRSNGKPPLTIDAQPADEAQQVEPAS
jgi:hypothetical protein